MDHWSAYPSYIWKINMNGAATDANWFANALRLIYLFLHLVCWLVVLGSTLMMDATELFGLKQVQTK